jgi:two-component system, OmpR family, KDP operon response regulator KdpE
VSDKRKTIMIVDDKADIRLALRIALSARGFEVVEAGSGEEALKKLRAEPGPDIILLDVNMPGLGGLNACRSIRAGSPAQIIVMSAQTSGTGKAEALSAGADVYIGKPFSIEELMLRIRAYHVNKQMCMATL